METIKPIRKNRKSGLPRKPRAISRQNLSIIEYRGSTPMPSLDEIGSRFGLSRQRISQILQKYAHELTGRNSTANKKPHTCHYCGKEFTPHTHGGKYCSSGCRSMGQHPLTEKGKAIAEFAIRNRPEMTWQEVARQTNSFVNDIIRYLNKYAKTYEVDISHCFTHKNKRQKMSHHIGKNASQGLVPQLRDA